MQMTQTALKFINIACNVIVLPANQAYNGWKNKTIGLQTTAPR
jgi:hypothetical protein